MKKHKGFTLVELIVVITIITILATIVIVGTNIAVKDSRDGKRQSNVTIIADALEKYYNRHGEYPSCQAMTSSSTIVTGQNGALQGIDKNVIIAPKAASGTDNSIICTDMTSTQIDYFAYIGDGTPNCATISCSHFTLKYIEEATNQIKTVASKH